MDWDGDWVTVVDEDFEDGEMDEEEMLLTELGMAEDDWDLVVAFEVVEEMEEELELELRCAMSCCSKHKGSS